MRTDKAKNRLRRRAGGLLFCVCCLGVLGGCGEQAPVPAVCVSDPASPFADALVHSLPGYSIEPIETTAFEGLNKGAAVEMSGAQAVPAVENGIAGYWYPQYLATVVIAIDREQTGEMVLGWRDLYSASATVGFSNEHPDVQLLAAAMSYALEGEEFTLHEATQLLSFLYDNNRLVLNDQDAAILICFDYEAAGLNRSGRNLEIIVPQEGSLTFEKGLLSPVPLSFAPETDERLLQAGLRLPNGQCAEGLYPRVLEYERAPIYTDFEHLTSVCQNVLRVLRRQVLHVRLYSSADGREHQLFALVFTVITIVWASAIAWRMAHRTARRAVLCIGLLLVGWVSLRVFKWLLPLCTLNRYCWYGFYLFQLALPVALLYLAWVIDKPDSSHPPVWLKSAAIANTALLLLVFTNDLHQWVFRFDLNSNNWNSNYQYGFAYYIVLFAIVLPIVLAVSLLLIKSKKSPQRGAFLFPFSVVVLLVLYGAGYILRVPLAWESDFTIMAGFFALLFVESAVQTGLIPVNTQYIPLFTHAPLNMQIFDPNGAVVLASAGAAALPKAAVRQLLNDPGKPCSAGKNTVLHAEPIMGGTAVWQENTGALNNLQQQIRQSIKRLRATNELLEREEALERTLHSTQQKSALFEQLEREIESRAIQLSLLTKELTLAKDSQKETARATLLLCYIKRRCNLFFREQEQDLLPAAELELYIDELAGLCAHAGIGATTASNLRGNISTRRATLFYDFFFCVIEWAQQNGCPLLLEQLVLGGGSVSMKIMPGAVAQALALHADLTAAIAAQGGSFEIKDLDGATGLSLSFPEGGESHG